ncbi:LytTR family DNA-binding domain-containing protein [Phenylobacterium aquaticum]|uniref:LytTR family DNA-binding domain-containing protein n=1 Tax=Phenylobacterium aquaticum TaxID=1763816 RepID=UPI0026EFCEC8|nr:LytTR family DNA-binding domain-containing protein [Phenylobacterium aquaticum]
MARRTDAAFLALFALVALAVVGVDVFSVAHERAEAGRPLPIWEPAVWELSSGLVLIALIPLVQGLTRRIPPRRPPAMAWAAIHLAALAAFSLVHVLAMGALRYLAYAAVGQFYDPLAPLGDWVYELRKDALVYVSLVGLYEIWRATAPPAPAQTPAGPAMLEIRDGARRRFLSLADIAWVEAAGNYVQIHGGEGAVLHRASLSQMGRDLASEGFVRIHRSRLVRRAAIRAVETSPSGDFTVSLASGEVLAGSRRYRAECLAHSA